MVLGKCNWCHTESTLVSGKRYCTTCGDRCFRECVRCKRPLDDPKYFALSLIRCNSCSRAYNREKAKRMNKVDTTVGAQHHQISSSSSSDTDTDISDASGIVKKEQVVSGGGGGGATSVASTTTNKRPSFVCDSDDSGVHEKKRRMYEQMKKKKKSVILNKQKKQQQRGRPRKVDNSTTLSKDVDKDADKMLEFLNFTKNVKDKRKKKLLGILAMVL